MDPQLANFLSRFVAQYDALLEQLRETQDINQEAFDRDYDTLLQTIDFSTYGELTYLSFAKIQAAFQAWIALKATLDANARENWTRLYGIIK